MKPVGQPQFETEPSLSSEVSPGYAAANAPRVGTVPSLPEAHRTIPIAAGASWFRKVFAFAGPGYLVAVGYMDPGNWATDIAGGSKFAYSLLSVIVISNFMAMFLQALSAKLGIATGRDLAQACREHYSRRTSFVLWVLCEIAIAACDLAEVLGSAVALKLLFGLPLLAGVLITAFDVLIVLALQGRGFRLVEAFVVTLIASIAACFAYEIFFAHPLWREAAIGFIPRAEILRNKEMLYIAIGILGATVTPSSIPRSPWVLRFSLIPRFWFLAPLLSTPAAFTTWRKSPTPTNFSAPSSVQALQARFSLAPCLPPDRTPRLPARWPGRS